MAQSLGGMEVIVGVSLLTGGLASSPSLPIPLTSNAYHVGRGIDTISGHDRCDYPSSRLNNHQPYPALHTLVERSEGISRNADKLDKWYNSDSLFRFTITAHSDRIVWMGHLEWDVVLNRILLMGIYN